MSYEHNNDRLHREIEDPIDIPGNDIREASIRFGKDQMVALGVNVGATKLTSTLLQESALTELQKATAETLAGPVFEKLGFYGVAFARAWRQYKSTDPSVRNLIVRTAKEGTRNTIKDFGVHDPAYILLMGVGQVVHPEAPAWMVSFISFFLATFVVGLVDVGVDELKYEHVKKHLQSKGFGHESYYEAKLGLKRQSDMRNVLEKVMVEFGLTSYETRLYNDTYYAIDSDRIREYNNRKASFRLRSRERQDQDGFMQSAQFLFTKANEMKSQKFDQFRYYMINKTKMRYGLDHMPTGTTLDAIDAEQDPLLKGICDKYLLPDESPTSFTTKRSYANDPDGAYIGVDENSETSHYEQVVELKVHKDKKLLQELIRFVLTEEPVQQTTLRKFS